LALAALLVPWRARGEPEDVMARAKTHFEAGRALYQLGNYDEAVREFTAGHTLVPRPQFLLNLGQCHRKLGDLESARAMYRRFLGEVPVDDPQRAEAEEVLAVIERGLAEEPRSGRHGAPARGQATSPPDQDDDLQALAVKSTPPRKPFIKRHWWIIPTSAVVVGLGVGLGVYYGTRGTNTCSQANLGCWTLEN
jgi:tetratricopeptide (TPR) repeat protein